MGYLLTAYTEFGGLQPSLTHRVGCTDQNLVLTEFKRNIYFVHFDEHGSCEPDRQGFHISWRLEYDILPNRRGT
jgi:hypothetical protein